MRAEPAAPGDPDSIPLALLAPWLTVVAGEAGEHVALSDGWHRIRLDVQGRRMTGEDAVLLHYALRGTLMAEHRLLTLRRLLALYRHRRFAPTLFPRDPRVPRMLAVLRVGDALAEGASQREIAAALFGEARVRDDWTDGSDALRSRVRRLVREAKAMAVGGYRELLLRTRRNR